MTMPTEPPMMPMPDEPNVLAFQAPPTTAMPWTWTLAQADQRSPDGERLWFFDVALGNAGLRCVANDAMLRQLADTMTKAVTGIEVVRNTTMPPAPPMSNGS